LKEVEKRKREKLEDLQARERVKQQIKEQQEARKRQAEKEKAAREGRLVTETTQPPKPLEPKVTTSHSESRLQLRLADQPPLVKTLPANTTLFEVASVVEIARGKYMYWIPCLYRFLINLYKLGFAPNSFTMTFPRKIFSKEKDFGLTLKEAGMVPSCSLLVN
jgi:hypothetical protein